MELGSLGRDGDNAAGDDEDGGDEEGESWVTGGKEWRCSVLAVVYGDTGHRGTPLTQSREVEDLHSKPLHSKPYILPGSRWDVVHSL
jgi:hypothetical protein